MTLTELVIASVRILSISLGSLLQAAIVCLSVSSIACGQSSTLPPVIVRPIVEMEVHSGYRVVGTVAPLRTSTIGAAVDGRVQEFLVDIGQRVRAGDALASLRSETLQIEKRAALAQLELYEQQLAELQNGSRPEDIQEAEAIAEGARAAMEIAANQLERLVSLSNSRAATEVDLEDARERANTTKSAYRAAEAALRRIKQGPREEQIAQARARVDLQEEQINLIEDRIDKHIMRAPFDGYVSAEYTEQGAWINGGDPVAQIIELDQIEIRAPVTADYATRLKLGETVRVEFPELPQKLLTGSVDRIVPMADPRARTYPVFIRLENEFRSDGVPMLLAGMLARVELPAGKQRQLPLVSKDALVLNQEERCVFVVEVDAADPTVGTVRKIPVNLGVATDDLIQVTSKLRDMKFKAGQLVVVVGNERLTAGDRVRHIVEESRPFPEG